MPDHAIRLWKWCHSLDWSHLPDAGGLLDQDERTMHDIMTIQWQYKLIKAHIEANATDSKMQGGMNG